METSNPFSVSVWAKVVDGQINIGNCWHLWQVSFTLQLKLLHVNIYEYSPLVKQSIMLFST